MKPNKGLLDKRRLKVLEKEKRLWLKNLSLEQAVALEEGILSSSLIWAWRKNFSFDNPVRLKDILNKKA